MSHQCGLCRGRAVETVIAFGSHPIAHRLLESADADELEHHVTLGFCTECGLSQLIDPLPPEQLYTNYHWLSSWKPNPHVPRLLELVADLPGLTTDSFVLEVGSNDGSFLGALRTLGYRRLLGVEPAADAVAAAAGRGVETLHAYFAPEAAGRIVDTFGPADLLIARQVLEHVGLPEFSDAMRTAMRPGTYVLVEVPDWDFNLDAPDYSAVWEEHIHHFTPETLTRFLAGVDVEVLHLETAFFSGRVLVALGRSAGGTVSPARLRSLSELGRRARGFRDDWPRFREAMHRYLESRRARGARVAVYGAGCRSCCLINYAGLGPQLAFAVDDQSEKHGLFMPGSRLPVLPSEALVEESIDLCLLAVNAENEDAVIARHRAFVERGGEFVSIHPPSPRLPEFWRMLRAAA